VHRSCDEVGCPLQILHRPVQLLVGKECNVHSLPWVVGSRHISNLLGTGDWRFLQSWRMCSVL
jgi:hypothetical protein